MHLEICRLKATEQDNVLLYY